MALQLSIAVRDAMNNALETTIGASAVLKIRTGAQPATCATADSGSVLATMSLPADWMSNSASGVKALLGTWQDLLADATGTAGHFRLYASDGTTCGAQGDITATGGGGTMTLDNISIAINQPVTITAFSLTGGGA